MLSRTFKSFKYFTRHPKINNKLLINGKFVDSKSGKTFPTLNPATEHIIDHIHEADQEDVEDAVLAAREAFDNGPWRKMSAAERGRLMFKLVDLMEKHADEFAFLESIDNGKPLQ
jgi:acyl-CoA reductase-like NAD-dependent aldehyde dehydrogenase